MRQEGQLMGVPVKLVIALVVGVMSMGILTQFVNTADRTMLRDMEVEAEMSETGENFTIEVFDAQSGEPLNGATLKVDYPGGTLAQTLDSDSNTHTFHDPTGYDTVIADLHVTHHGYIPWQGQFVLKN